MSRLRVCAAFLGAAMLEACGSHGAPGGVIPAGSIAPASSVVPPPSTADMTAVATMSATPAPMPSSQMVGSGEIFGTDNIFTPNDGDTSRGGQGQTIDGIPCASTMPNTYHVHAFVGIIINGRHLALPDGIGMKNPGADGTYYGIPNWTQYASCYYYIHAHDASGVLHIESPQSASLSTSLYTLGSAFDVWGMTLSTAQVGPYTGTVRTYVAQVPLKTTSIQRTSYTLYTSNPRTIPLHSHTTIWLEVGPTYLTPSQFPVINYYEEY